MYIIVVGGGKVGFHLAKELLDEGHEVLIIERDSSGRRIDQIQEALGDVVLKGDGCEASTLETAGAERADMLIAVTGDDEDNLVSCQVGKARFKVRRTVARLNNPKNELIFRKLGIDVTVSATAAILSQMEQELPTHRLVPLVNLRNSGLELVEVKIPPRARVVGQRATDLLLPQGAMVTLVIDEEGTARLPADSVLHANDVVIAVTRVDHEEQLRRVLAET